MGLEGQSRRGVVEARLREAITAGVYPPGTHLPDRALCEEFGVSRSIVREAIRLLQAEGLVTALPHRGPFVSFITADEAAQIYEIRASLEALAGQGFAERATHAERAALRAEFETLARAEGAAREAVLERKQAFYAILLQGCRNDHLARMLNQLLNLNTQLRATSLSEPGRFANTIGELRLIVEAAERRDGAAAAAACQAHVQAAAGVALRVLRARESEAAAARRGRRKSA